YTTLFRPRPGGNPCVTHTTPVAIRVDCVPTERFNELVRVSHQASHESRLFSGPQLPSLIPDHTLNLVTVQRVRRLSREPGQFLEILRRNLSRGRAVSVHDLRHGREERITHRLRGRTSNIYPL